MTNEKFIGFTMEKTKHIALVAHDGKKKELVEWCDRNKDVLKNHSVWYGYHGEADRGEDGASGEGVLQRSSWRRSADRFTDR